MLQHAAVSILIAVIASRLGSGSLLAGLEGVARNLFCALLVVAAASPGGFFA